MSTEAPTQPTSESLADEGQLPPQRHAGAVGLGPAYGQGAVSVRLPHLRAKQNRVAS
jgi:hypothetical protein